MVNALPLASSHPISRVVNSTVLVLAILFEDWRKYRQYFSCAMSIWVSQYTFSLIFMEIFDTNTSVVRCTSLVCQQHYCD